MKNIIIVTSLYPVFSKENNATAVCHFFARDFVKLGYNVKVIHIQPEYPWYIKLLINTRSKITGVKPGGGYYYKETLRSTMHYIKDNVPIWRIPIKKLYPSKPFSKRTLEKLATEVENLFSLDGFVPELIIGHMLSLSVIPVLNRKFKAKTCMVAHSAYQCMRTLIDYYDVWGFRSIGLMEQFEKYNGPVDKTFICYSGIPEQFIAANNSHIFDKPICKFIYVGDFIERKYPAEVMESIAKVYPNKDFVLKYVGNGPLEKNLRILQKKLNLDNNVIFTGRIPREQIPVEYDKSDCQIMISRGEAFGLVYLEAMARGCIVIGAKKEGIDGVINDGDNGFLCEAGNVGELTTILSRLRTMPQRELQRISDNALKTACEFTDLKAAKKYIKDIERLLCI